MGALQPDRAAIEKFEQHKAKLIELAVPNPRLSAEEETKIPMRIERFGFTGPEILMIHGGSQAISQIGGGPQNFNGQLPIGKDGWRVTLPHRPGFGRSPSRGKDDMLADQRWIKEIMDANPDGCHIWGHSFGGAEALLAAAANPEKTRSLTMIEPNLWPLAMECNRAELHPDIRSEVEAREEALLRADTPGAYAANFLTGFQPAKGGLSVWLTRKAINLAPGLTHKIGSGLLVVGEANGTQMLEAIETIKKQNIPVLVVTGGWNPPRDALGKWAADLTNGTYAHVPSSDHIIMAKNPKGLNARVVEFMKVVDQKRNFSS